MCNEKYRVAAVYSAKHDHQVVVVMRNDGSFGFIVDESEFTVAKILKEVTGESTSLIGRYSRTQFIRTHHIDPFEDSIKNF